MEKRYQVFVSSTYSDLKEERGKVMQTVMSLDCIPAGMELFPAIDEEQFEFIKKIIDDCDYYILIVGGKYGSISDDGISYTEKEYDYAVSKGIPVIAFLHNDIGKIALDKCDTDEAKRKKLFAFRDKVSKGRLVQFWDNPDELNGKVAVSLMKTIKIYPAVGWVRANMLSNTESLQEINALRKEIDLLKNEKAQSEQKLDEKISSIADLDETINITGIVLEWDRDYGGYSQIGKWEHSYQWDEIFVAIAPHFIESKTDARAQSEIGDILYDLAYPEVESCGDISDKSFNTIKIQLMALGLMDVCEKIGGVYWKLSKKGIRKMIELGAVKTTKQL